jgi:hypothetical protein
VSINSDVYDPVARPDELIGLFSFRPIAEASVERTSGQGSLIFTEQARRIASNIRQLPELVRKD